MILLPFGLRNEPLIIKKKHCTGGLYYKKILVIYQYFLRGFRNEIFPELFLFRDNYFRLKISKLIFFKINYWTSKLFKSGTQGNQLSILSNPRRN